MQTIVNLVSAGMGVAWVPESVTQLQRPGVVYRRVSDASLLCETSLLWREPAMPVVERFVAHVQSVKGNRNGKAARTAAPVRRQSAAGGPKPPRR